MCKESKRRGSSRSPCVRRSSSSSRKRSRRDREKGSRRNDCRERSSRSPIRGRRDRQRSRHGRLRSRSRDHNIRKRRSESDERSSSRSSSRRRNRTGQRNGQKKFRKDESRERSRSSSCRRSQNDREKLKDRRSKSRSHDRKDRKSKRENDRESSLARSPNHKRSRMDEIKNSEINHEEIENEKKKSRMEKWKELIKESSEIIPKKSDTSSDLATTNSSIGKDEVEKPAEAEKTIKNESNKELYVSQKLKDDYDENGDQLTDNLMSQANDDEDPLDAYMKDIITKTKKLVNQSKVKLNSLNNTNNCNTNTVEPKKVTKPLEKFSNDSDEDIMPEEPTETLTESLAMLNKTKELKVDHSQIDYIQFKKDFYIEVPEIKDMTNEEVKAYRRTLGNMTVVGKNCPKPIKTWAQCGAHPKVLDTLKKHKFDKPTPIQAQAIPIVMSGRDMIGIAKTGSGKTLAFLIPMFRHILNQPELNEGEGPIALIITPTRELAKQICTDCYKFTKALGLRATCIYGGSDVSNQIANLKRGAEIVVCTPGRMIDILKLNNGRITNLSRVTYVVVDEADRMLDEGFGPQVKTIMNGIRPDRMVIMFSATFPPKMQHFATTLLRSPIQVTVGEKSVVCSDVEQHILVMEENQKFSRLLELLEIYQSKGLILVFVQKQECSDELMANLVNRNYPCLSLHGGIEQDDRTDLMKMFKNGEKKLMIATSVCSRGLDVKDLILVVNYDCPNHYEEYVHRCGRTGRAGNKGYAYTFISPNQANSAENLIKALERSKLNIPEDLKNLWENYKTQMEAEGKKIYHSGGFGGKGYAFDEAEKKKMADQKSLARAIMGGEECDEELNKHIDKIFSSCKKVSQTDKPTDKSLTISIEKLLKAQQAASMINTIKQNDTVVNPVASSIALAEQSAKVLNERLGFSAQEEELEEQKVEIPDVKFEVEVEINDLPQNIRSKITNKGTLGQICEYSGANLQVRGIYFPEKQEPKNGERKLYITIDAVNMKAVEEARKELERIFKEEIKKLGIFDFRSTRNGRYTVV